IRAVRGVDGGKVNYDPQIVVNHMVNAERTMVTYFLRRCWFEGRSKAYVSALVGSRDGISQERTYLIRTLPRGIVRGLSQMILNGDWGGGARAGFMLIGLFITIAGYLTGRLSQLKSGSVFTLFGKGQAEVSGLHVSIEENLELVGVSEFESELAELIVDDHLPFATVVVPSVFARLEQLRSCLDSLISLDYPKYEIIVVDNRRDDSDVLPNWFSYDDKVRILRERFPGISAARNRGIKEAAGEVIAFTDDDVEVDVNWLRNLVHSLLSRRDIGCVTGLVLPKDLDTPAKRWFEEYLGGFNRGTEVKLYCPATLDEMRFIGSSKVRRVTCINVESNSVEELSLYQAIARCGAGANMGFRRDALRAAGGFNLALGTGTPARGGEDLAMFAAIFQMHHCVVYDPKAVVYHSHRDSYQELVRQISGSGIGLTAMLSSLVVEDPSHLKAILGKVPLAAYRVIKLRFGSRDTQMTGVPKTFPPSLRWHELVGMLQGPLAYVHSRHATKRESWAHRFQSNFSESDGIT
ncbi:MAG: glycosyltransferase, partial [Acidimicrobiaceae bacterium]|nr:glycosyltransferase [Acidimicrobiaceae bacterium]